MSHFPKLRHALLLKAAVIAVAALSACMAPPQRAVESEPEVLFVCEHGNVKSLMAASYFNELAQQRGLKTRALARAAAPNSTSVPPGIVAGLHGDGFDVATFSPTAVTTSDVSSSQHVIVISTRLPAAAAVAGMDVESWDDVPPASVDYAAARTVLKDHVARLVGQLNHHEGK